MKNNIDLTENRIFSRDSFGLWNLTITDLLKFDFPWNVHLTEIRSDDEFDLDHQRKSIIATGNKKQRAEVQHYREMDSLDYCDCCGAKMNLIPWNREIGVCRKCEEYYESHDPIYDKCLWRKKDIIHNAVIRIS